MQAMLRLTFYLTVNLIGSLGPPCVVLTRMLERKRNLPKDALVPHKCLYEYYSHHVIACPVLITSDALML